MKELPIGLVIKEIIQKKKLSVGKLSEKLGMSRQGIYNTYSRTTMHEGEIDKWCNALGIKPEELISPELNHGNEAATSFAEETLNSIRKMLEEELREKNEQIKALQEALRESQQMSRVLLGKSREYSDLEIMPLWGSVLTDAIA